MSRIPNPDRDERVAKIRERAALTNHSLRALINSGNVEELERRIIAALSLLDSQADETCLHCEKPIRRIGSAWLHVENKLVSCRRGKSQEHNGIYRAEPATKESIATRMRDRCVQKVRAIRNAYGDGKNREYDYGFHRALDTVESALSHLENSDGRPTQS